MMNSVLVQTRSILSRPDTLRAGHAPAHWKHELSREAHRLAMEARICGWLKAFAQAYPLLLDQPLFGNCLREITVAHAPASEAATRHSQVGPPFKQSTLFKSVDRKIFEGPRTSELRRKANSGASPVSGPAGQAELLQNADYGQAVLKLPAQVATSLLKRLAGTVMEMPDEKVKSSAHTSSLAFRKESSTAPLVEPSLAHKDWQRLVAYRAATAWLRDWPTAMLPGSHSPGSVTSVRALEGQSASPLLAQQWFTRFTGPRALPGILKRCAENAANSERATFEAPHARSDWQGDSSKSFSHRPEFAGPDTSMARRIFPTVTGKSFKSGNIEADSFEPDQQSVTSEFERAVPFEPKQLPTISEGEWRTSSNVAPPALAASLPPLLPSSPRAEASPIAAATARESARRDEAAAQAKDLNLLAAQMKRILEEEARRHGIDV
jgi:hypothetical protein